MVDDRLGLARGYTRCWLDIFTFVRFACSLGCHFGIPKCILWPQRRAQYLGMILDMHSKLCCIPAAKLAKFDAAVQQVLSANTVTARQLASIAGMLVGFAVAVPLSKLYTHQLFLALTGQLSWDQVLPVDADLQTHLAWLQQYVPANNGKRWMQQIYEVCAEHDIDLTVEWRPKEDVLLQHADWHSKKT